MPGALMKLTLINPRASIRRNGQLRFGVVYRFMVRAEEHLSYTIPRIGCGGDALTRYSSMSTVELIQACVGADNAAWEEFVVRFHRPISLSTVRIAYQWGEIPQQVVDDLVQETYLKLCANKCRQLLEFAAEHPDAIPGYIKTIAVNIARDHFKSLHSQKRGSGEVSQIMEDADSKAGPSTLGGQDAMEQEVLFKQIDECIESCLEGPDRERDRTIFWLYYQQGMTAKDIAALPRMGLSTKGVESVLVRVIRLLRERLVGMQVQIGSKPTQGEKGFLPAESF
jgi:RNA polymerase sigma-70 factor (ECF subfamily)